MKISDLLTLVGILLAIVAFISEKNRSYVFLKFSTYQKGGLILSFLFINFLLSYEWWKEKFTWLSYFEKNGWPPASGWAYIFSICTLIFAIYKIFSRSFPLSNKENVMKYYENLLMRGDVEFLSELVQRYHLQNVKNFLKVKKTITIADDTDIWFLDDEKYEKEYSKKVKSRKLLYGESVYNRIVLDDTFIDQVANINPYLFASIICELDSEELQNYDFVNRFLKVITLNKNAAFFREIRNNQNYNTTNRVRNYLIEDTRPIIFSLFKNVEVASINQAWRGIAEQAIVEMYEEAKKGYSLLRESEIEKDEDSIWTFRIKIAIWYFDIMVRESISQNVNDHMWMFYYRHFVELILSNMEDLPFPTSDKNHSSRSFKLMEEIFSKMMDWKDVAIDSKHYSLSKSIYDCIGQCIYELVISDKLNESNKRYLINWVWEDLIKTFAPYNKEKDNEDDIINERAEVEKIITYGFNMFKNPSTMLNFTYPDSKTKAYIDALRNLWDMRDRPILSGLVGERADRFKAEVIDKLT